MGFYDDIPLFVDTSLGTHFALSVSQDITAGDLKGKLGMEHFSCFPNLGKIKVHGLMVKKKSYFYHLSDSMAIKHVFEGLSGTRLLHLEASSMQNQPEDISSVPLTLHSTSPGSWNLSLPNSSPHGDNQNQNFVTLNVADYKRLSPIANEVAECLQSDATLTRDNARSDHSQEQAEMLILNTSRRKNVKKRNSIEHHNPVEVNRWTKNREVKSTFDASFNIELQPKYYDINECKPKLNDKSTISEHPIEGKEHESCLSIMENSSKITQTISVTGIISRFFSEFDEVDSSYCQLKHIRETIQVHKNEPTVSTLASQPDHMNNRETVVSDTDTQCSFAKKQEDNTSEIAKVASKEKKQPLRSRKLFGKKSSLCTPHISSRMYTETSSSKSCKNQVGKRLVQAANSIQASGSGNRPATMFLSRCRKLTNPDSALLVRRIAFDVVDFVD